MDSPLPDSSLTVPPPVKSPATASWSAVLFAFVKARMPPEATESVSAPQNSLFLFAPPPAPTLAWLSVA